MMIIAKKLALFLLLALTYAAPCHSEISKCIGPNGEIHFTDRECPSGFSLNTTIPSTPFSPDKVPYEEEWSRCCHYISVMSIEEVNAAIGDVEKILLTFRQNNNLSLFTKWDTCYFQLKAKRSVLAPPPNPEFVKPPAPPEKAESIEPICREGVFTTDNHSSSYDVYFTNTSKRECQSVKAYCLCSVSFGSYKQSKDISFTGSFLPGVKANLTNISLTGPIGRDIDWSWCKFK